MTNLAEQAQLLIALTNEATAKIAAGAKAEGLAILNRALEVAHEIEDVSSLNVAAFANIAEAQASAGERTAAEASLRQARCLAEAKSDAFTRDFSRECVIDAQIAMAAYSPALEVARAVEDEEKRGRMLAKVLAAAGVQIEYADAATPTPSSAPAIADDRRWGGWRSVLARLFDR